VQETLKSERMGHDVPGMAGVYGHIMPEWRDRLRSQLEQVWGASLRERARLGPRSSVAIVDALIAPDRAAGTPSGPTMAPLRASQADPASESRPQKRWSVRLSRGVSEGIRTPDIQDHNLAL
jgi:hypothetical protein